MIPSVDLDFEIFVQDFGSGRVSTKTKGPKTALGSVYQPSRNVLQSPSVIKSGNSWTIGDLDIVAPSAKLLGANPEHMSYVLARGKCTHQQKYEILQKSSDFENMPLSHVFPTSQREIRSSHC